jgi:hypothetical protein
VGYAVPSCQIQSTRYSKPEHQPRPVLAGERLVKSLKSASLESTGSKGSTTAFRDGPRRQRATVQSSPIKRRFDGVIDAEGEVERYALVSLARPLGSLCYRNRRDAQHAALRRHIGVILAGFSPSGEVALGLQLLLEFVQEPPVRPVRDDLLRARFDNLRLVQP